jgi:hypothetical protein
MQSNPRLSGSGTTVKVGTVVPVTVSFPSGLAIEYAAVGSCSESRRHGVWNRRIKSGF